MYNIKINIKLKAFHSYYLNTFIAVIQKWMSELNSFSVKQVFLPSKKEHFTVLRSPHVDKKARDQFVKITHKRLLVLELLNASNEDIKTMARFLEFLKRSAVGVEISVRYNISESINNKV